MPSKFENAVVEYESGNTSVKLSPSIIRNYLVSGNGKVSDQEIVMFLNLCKAQRLNPFIREAYLIKYGNAAATMVVGKDVFTKRASKNPAYAGFEAGVHVLTVKGELQQRTGALVLPSEEIVGGWAKVYMKGYAVPIESSVSFTEFCQMKDGRPASSWAKIPAVMIRKVAIVHAMREAFPEDLQGLYDSAEMHVNDIALDENPVTVDTEITRDEIAGDEN